MYALAEGVYEAGVPGPTNQHDLLRAIITAIDYSDNHPVRKKKKKNCSHVCSTDCTVERPMVYTEKDLLTTLPVELEVVRYGKLTRVLRCIALREGDLAAFETWFTESMYPWMQAQDVEFTYSMLCRKYPEWLEKARQYNGTVSGTSTENWR